MILDANAINHFHYCSASRSLSKTMKSMQADDKLISTITSLTLEYLGINILEFEQASIAGTVETAGGVQTVTDSTLPRTVLKEKHAKATMIASQDFYQQWKESMAVPIDAISDRFSYLKTADRPVVVTPRVPPEAVSALHDQLARIDPAYSCAVFLKDHLKNVPKLIEFIDSHVVATPYSYSIQRCTNVACCGEMRSPVENGIRELVMQRQPTPQAETHRKGHFLRRDQSLVEHANNPSSLVDLSCLHSNIGDPLKVDARKKTKRDTALTKVLNLKSWDAKKVRAVLKCYHCAKPRCIYSPVEASFNAATTALQQKMESVSNRFSCGDLLFEDSHHLSKVLVQQQALNCESRIEKGYYNHKDRKLKLPDICIYCGEEGAEESVLCQTQLIERKLTEGKICYPLCASCLKNGKKVLKTGRKDILNLRQERAGTN